MNSAPQLERWRQQDDACITRRWSVGAAGQVRGRVKLVGFPEPRERGLK